MDIVRQRKITNEVFDKGLITAIEANSIKRGASSGSLGWLSRGDHIELCPGMLQRGSDAGAGRVTGLHTTKDALGNSVTWRTRGRKLEYWDDIAADWVEVGTDILPAAADGEDTCFSDYVSLAGNQVFFSSPNSSLIKLLAANPGDYADQYDSTKNFKGRIKAMLNRLFLWGRTADKTGIYGSYIDNAIYTTVSAEAVGGAGANRTGTLGFKAGGAKRTCFAVSFTDGTETFTDDFAGNLSGSAGGSGKINYVTGAYDITFKVAPVNPVTADYQWEDSTNKGLADFSKSSPRQSSQGFIFRQDIGGEVQNVPAYNDILYCLHRRNTWRLDISEDDALATNRIFRESAGSPYWRASVATGEGIYYVDDSDQVKPVFRLLTIDTSSGQVVPVSKSLNLDLSGYLFDRAAMIEYGDYVLVACRSAAADHNDMLFAYNRVWKTYDILPYPASCFTIRDGALWAGDSSSNNVYELFSGYDFDESVIENHWNGKLDDLDVASLKKCKRLRLQGMISASQSYKISLALDNGDFVEIGTVSGTGDYVDKGTPITVGNSVVGTKIVGEGEVATAYNYFCELSINTDKFKEAMVRFEALGIGFVSISMYEFFDIRIKDSRMPSKYRN